MSNSKPDSTGRLIADVLWSRRDEVSIEHCRILEHPDYISIDGRVLSAIDGRPYRADYTIRCDREWRTQTVLVHVVEGMTSRIELERLPTGGWRRDGADIPGSDDLIDIDLSITPATNTLPIRRLGLGIGESAAVEALWVVFPELRTERLSQTYTRTHERALRYTSNDGNFVARLKVDDEGVVVTYGDLWERIGPG